MSKSVHFPGKPGRMRRKGTISVIQTEKHRLKTDKYIHIERTRLFVDHFTECTGQSSDEEDEFFGFSQRELERSRNKMGALNTEINTIRHELSSEIENQFEQKFKSILPAKGSGYKKLNNIPTTKFKTTNNPTTKYKTSNTNTPVKPTPEFPSPVTSLVKHSARRKSSRVESSDEQQNSKQSSSRKSSRVNSNEEADNLKPKVSIQIPSWRRVSKSFDNWKNMPGEIEDLSDEAYLLRHQKAESEEQILWERWQKLREYTGEKSRGGRSKSRRWKEVVINLPDGGSDPTSLIPAKRCRRISSLQSEDSFSSGRLSPRTGNLQEIMIMGTAPPTPIPELADGDSSAVAVTAAVAANDFGYSFSNDSHDSDIDRPTAAGAAFNINQNSMPLSPPLSPASLSPPHASQNRSRTISLDQDSLFLHELIAPDTSSSSSTSTLLLQTSSPQKITPLPPKLMSSTPKSCNDKTTNGKWQSVAKCKSGGRRSLPVVNRKSPQLTSPPKRDWYPLRSQSPSRRTRLGSRR